MKPVRILLAVGILFLFAACEVQQAREIKGKWQKEGGKETLAFVDPNVLTLSGGQTELTTTFRVADNKTLQVDLGSLGPITVQFAVSNETLTLTDAKGSAAKYVKVKPAPPAPPKAPEPAKK